MQNGNSSSTKPAATSSSSASVPATAPAAGSAAGAAGSPAASSGGPCSWLYRLCCGSATGTAAEIGTEVAAAGDELIRFELQRQFNIQLNGNFEQDIINAAHSYLVTKLKPYFTNIDPKVHPMEVLVQQIIAKLNLDNIQSTDTDPAKTIIDRISQLQLGDIVKIFLDTGLQEVKISADKPAGTSASASASKATAAPAPIKSAAASSAPSGSVSIAIAPAAAAPAPVTAKAATSTIAAADVPKLRV